jgi:hypothetical protein
MGIGWRCRRAGCDPSALAALKARCMQLLLPHLDGYIWQRDRFDLRLSTEEMPPWCLPRKGRSKGEQQRAPRPCSLHSSSA